MVHGTNRSTSWTDDLPKCSMTGSAMARNGRYKPDGKVNFEHDFEDRHLSVRYDAGGVSASGSFLYGVFDGHDGSARASEYAQDKFPADLLYDRLEKAHTEKQLCEALRQSFLAVEGGFFASLDATLARRAQIRGQLPPGLNDYQLYEKVPGLVTELQSLNEAITGGTTAALALIHQNSLFTANVGDSRVVLATCANSVLPMISHVSGGLAPAQDLVEAHLLTVDHDCNNDAELERLSSIGLDRDRIRRNKRVGSHENTRSIGDYSMKGGYKEFEEIRQAVSEPLVAEPFIQRALPIQNNWLFMFLMSDGVYKAVEESHGLPSHMANVYIAQIISHLLMSSASIQAATEGALNYILTDHLKAFLSGDQEKAIRCRKRDDCTLVVRCFHHAVPLQPPLAAVPAKPPVYECVGASPTSTSSAGGENKLSIDTSGTPKHPAVATASASTFYTPTGSPLPLASGGLKLSSSATSGEYAFKRLGEPLSSASSGDKTPFFAQTSQGSSQQNPFVPQTSGGDLTSIGASAVVSGTTPVSAASSSPHSRDGSFTDRPDRAAGLSLSSFSSGSNTDPSPTQTSPRSQQPPQQQQPPCDPSKCPPDMVLPHAGFSVPANFPDHFPPELDF
eukprot:scpid57702/ scgid32497/ TGF-beta-activated kinase 1 and MAP3K7-binding protein 1; Mitogen-activated protein kinase kinase kinase 7-interacting protein 1; TGF-beta-activated kinase 1-binding protein 1